MNAKTRFCGPLAPDLGLADDLEAEQRIYLLKCAPQVTGGPYCWYVGLAHRARLAQRVQQHFEGRGADFTAERRPVSVELVWPAANAAAEAYLFYAMMAKFPQAAAVGGRLGGWTQTRPKPSNLCQALLQESKRMLDGRCLACGGSGHVAKDRVCPKADRPDAALLACGHCQATLSVTPLGAVRTTPPGRAANAKAEAKRPQSVSAEAPPPPKRRATAAVAIAPAAARPDAPAPAAAAVARTPFARVLVLGHKYTALEWFLGRGASPRERKQALSKCGAHAVRLSGGTPKTLVVGGYAKAPPLRCKELWPSRSNFPAAFTDTACPALRPPGGPVRAKLDARPSSLKNALLRVADLEEHFNGGLGPPQILLLIRTITLHRRALRQ